MQCRLCNGSAGRHLRTLTLLVDDGGTCAGSDCKLQTYKSRRYNYAGVTEYCSIIWLIRKTINILFKRYGGGGSSDMKVVVTVVAKLAAAKVMW